MEKLSIKPSASGLVRIDGGEKFGSALRRSQALDREGRAEEACRMRFDAVQRLDDLLGDDPVALDWADGATRSCLELIYASAADHFAIGDAEMAAALWERLLELDEEDHTEAVVMLAFCYVELEDYDCFDDALFDISSKSSSAARAASTSTPCARCVRAIERGTTNLRLGSILPTRSTWPSAAASGRRHRPRRASCGSRRLPCGSGIPTLSRRCGGRKALRLATETRTAQNM